jgi:uncharacterized protein YndB with AHSA1/START domain
MNVMRTNRMEDSDVTYSRLVAATVGEAFAAWTAARALERWWAPAEAKLTTLRLELWPGGEFHYRLAWPEGAPSFGKWVFREIVERDRLEFVVCLADQAGRAQRHPTWVNWPLETLLTVRFAAHDGATLISLRWVPTNASPRERDAFFAGHEAIKQTCAELFERLCDYLDGA